MYYMNNDAFDYFAADFTQEESIVGAEHHPLGYYAVEALENAYRQAAELRGPVRQFQEDMQAFLAARDPSSMAEAYQSAKRLWQELEKLPVYNKLLVGDYRINALLPYMRRHPEEVDDMLTPGTQRNEMYTRWMTKLDQLDEDLNAFARNTEWMLREYFDKLPSRRRETYAAAFGQFQQGSTRQMSGKRRMEKRNLRSIWTLFSLSIL